MPTQKAGIHELAGLVSSGSLDRARQLALELARSSPDDAQLLALLGSVHGRLAEFTDAERCYERLAALEPGSFQHYLYLGLSRIMQNRLGEAVAPFEAMLRVHPAFAEGHMQMGCLQRDLGNYERATLHLRYALKLAPALPDAAVFLANLLIHQGDLSEAESLYDRVLAVAPNHPDALAGKSLLLERRGDADAAWEHLTAIVAVGKISPGIAISYAKLATRHGCAAQARSHLNELLAQADWAPSQRQEMHFSLGELEDRSGNYASAFSHIHAANELSQHEFDIESQRKKMRSVIDLFGSSVLPSAEVPPGDVPIPIFIVGMPRSGTSLVEQILACHPEVAAAGELEAMSHVEHASAQLDLKGSGYPSSLCQASSADMTRLAAIYLETISAIARGARYVTDKLPANYERLGFIERLFPNARIIHVVRDPRDTCLSCYFQNFGRTQTFSSNLGTLGEVYRIYEWTVSRWLEMLQIPILTVHYEELVTDTERRVRAMLEFCGLSWEPRCLEFHNAKRYVHTASYHQVRQPIYRKSVGRWQNYQPYLKELIKALCTEEAQ